MVTLGRVVIGARRTELEWSPGHFVGLQTLDMHSTHPFSICCVHHRVGSFCLEPVLLSDVSFLFSLSDNWLTLGKRCSGLKAAPGVPNNIMDSCVEPWTLGAFSPHPGSLRTQHRLLIFYCSVHAAGYQSILARSSFPTFLRIIFMSYLVVG